MDPVDFRNATFASLQSKLAGQRAAALQAWHTYGPGTTAEVCARAGLSILTFRPRTTELFQLGFITCVDGEPSTSTSTSDRAPTSGHYRVRTTDEHRAWLAAKQIDARPGQQLLKLGAGAAA